MSDIYSFSQPLSPALDSQSSKSLVNNADVEEWEDVSFDSDPKDMNEDGSDKEGQCDKDDNSVKAKGGADNVEALGFL